jgi:hypothetical protein
MVSKMGKKCPAIGKLAKEIRAAPCEGALCNYKGQVFGKEA